MALTVDELMQMQEEAEKVQQASQEGAGVTSAGESEEKVVDDSKAEGIDDGKEKTEVKKEGSDAANTSAKKDEGKDKEEVDVTDEELRELREIARAQKMELNRVTKEYERLNNILKEKGLIDEEDEKARQLQEAQLRANYESRLATLGEILEVMKVNPRYEDVEEVVSQRHFDDMVAAMATYYVRQHGGNVQQAAIDAEREIWSLPNPYRYMYELIKKYHPDYATASTTNADKDREAKPSTIVKEVAEKAKEFKEQIRSLQDLPGGSVKDAGGWTAAKIDALDEDELHKVPADIYERYLRGTLA